MTDMNDKDQLRHLLNPRHPVFEGRQKLTDEDVIQEFDETACVSCLLRLDGEKWYCITNQEDGDIIGKTVKWACEESGDCDGSERVFRRVALTK